MNLVILGSGSMARFLGERFYRGGHRILQVFSRTPEHAGALATDLNSEPISDINHLNPLADAYVLALPDHAIREYSLRIPLSKACLIHCSGAHSIDILNSGFENRACIWVVYSVKQPVVSKDRSIPVVVEATTAYARQTAEELAATVSSTIYKLSAEQKAFTHLGAVMVNNFSTHLYHIAYQLLHEKQVSFEILKPILQETIELLSTGDPGTLQTGPAVRHDEVTLQKQMNMLEKHPHWKFLYEAISRSIQESSS
ncbi:MAG TPA: DUF2520 domain-containing protein [Chitinophagaceae bacterium]|nr:DUF2520 domain-containing protein [Chitinophagaceae bacterium]HNF71097.1 DUF2520 domain-containing protein [Chitinophagaceae bacterium]